MYKKIMVAVDGSETGMQAVKEAENIAKTYNATLRIVHSIGGDTDADKQAGNEVLQKAKSAVSALNIETSLVEAEIEYGLNGITEAIAKAVGEWDADLVVVGTANRRGLERFFVGSVAEQLVTKVDSSILLVRPKN